MKKLFILLLIMTMIMPVIPAESEESNRGNSFGTFSGADKINAQLALNPGSWPFFSKLYYLPSTLPKEIIAAEISEAITPTFIAVFEAKTARRKTSRPR